MFEQAREDQQPWMERGNEAGNMLAMYLGIPGAQAGGSSGGQTRRNTQAEFDPAAYLAANRDVAAAGVDPWFHWVQHGQHEGRTFTMTPDAQAARTAADAQSQQQQTDRSANPLYGSLLRPYTGEDLLREPGYQFRLNEGLGGVERSAAARGGLFSGATLRALDRYRQDYASGEYMNAFNRNLASNQNTFNMLSGVSGTGQVSAQQLGNQGIQTGAMVGNNLIGAGNARGAGYIGQSNAWSNALNQGASAFNQYNNNRNRPNNSFFRYDDPYRNPGYFGGDEGE